MARESAAEFRSLAATFEGNPRGLLEAAYGRDYEVGSIDWFVEVGPYHDDPNEQRKKLQRARAVIVYNIWALSVQRPTATLQDVIGGLGEEGLSEALLALLSFPRIQSISDWSTWSTSDLSEHLATLRAQVVASQWLGARGEIDVILRGRSLEALDASLAAELAQRHGHHAH
ncbi:hypothetical protein [Leifsonia aquatica]|uniref:hypothetical protein n=1 Tax=Leifsonia aquatica TaxID=144185 RepID=UPI0028A716EB|nr:hypothetical protein [Leifsonia aquatica]